MNTKKVTRIEIINHTPCDNCDGTGIYHTPTDSAAGQSISFSSPCSNCNGSGMPGRTVLIHNAGIEVDLELQDDDRTLKIFVHERTE